MVTAIRTATIALLLKFEQLFSFEFRNQMFSRAGVPNFIRQAYVECDKCALRYRPLYSRNMTESAQNLFIIMQLNTSDIQKAISSAIKGREKRPDVVEFMASYAGNLAMLAAKLEDGTFMELVEYREMTIVNNNGSVRNVLSPRLLTLILQHLCCNLLLPYYERMDVGIGLNCKKGCGITAHKRNNSVLKRMKHLFFDLRQYSHLLCIDQRKCYYHVSVKTFRKALKYLGVPKWLNDYACEICFYNGQFPIGTPTSPLAHHIIMLKYDRFLAGLGGYVVRYADNTYMAFRDAGEANAAMWRIKNFWWYELGMRAKRHSAKVYDMDKQAVDVCGYVLHRTPDKGTCSHNKGYTTIRNSTFANACNSTNRNWGSYFGILKHADTFSAMRKIENDMKLSQLTDKIKITRNLDADPIPIKTLAENGTIFTIHDYDVRFKQNKPDWIKCLIGISEDNKEKAYEFHGSYAGIANFIVACEAEFGKANMLPIEDVVVENRCGYVFKDSTNVIKYI